MALGGGHDQAIHHRQARFLLQTQTAAERLAEAQSGLQIPIAERLVGFIGIGVMILLAYLLSWDRKRINWRVVASGFALQALFGVVVLKTDAGRWVFEQDGDLITGLLGFQEQGARFVFGNRVQSTVPVSGEGVAAGTVAQTGAFFAFNVLPTIIFFSALMSVMYYLGVMQLIAKGLAGDAEDARHVGGGDALGVGQHLPGADRGAAPVFRSTNFRTPAVSPILLLQLF